MTTHTLTGAAIYSTPATNDPVAADGDGATLEIVVPDSETSFTYSVEPFFPGIDFGEAIFDLDLYTVRVNDQVLDFSLSSVTPSFLQIGWTQSGLPRSTAVLELVVDNVTVAGLGTVTAEYLFHLSGDPLPALESAADANTFITSFTSGSNPSGAFAPGVTIPLASLGGTSGQDDLISGTSGNDIFAGGAGNDIFVGSAGADMIDGGPGRDAVSYLGQSSGVRVDLSDPATNTGAAAGDMFTRIEIVLGTSFADTLISDAGKHSLFGLGGKDTLIGGAGNDLLSGASGSDWMIGGAGADTFLGGGGRDTADYSQSQIGLTIDMDDTSQNTGEAEGDRYGKIENIAGSDLDDQLFGDGGHNSLLGRRGDDQLDGRAGNDFLAGNQGEDVLIGRAGNDKLAGGDGDDWLHGGAGDDSMTGGKGTDTFVFNDGRDRIADFAGDRLRLDDALWTGTLTKAEVLELAQVEGANTVFRFEGGDMLIIENYTDIAGLENVLTLF